MLCVFDTRKLSIDVPIGGYAEHSLEAVASPRPSLARQRSRRKYLDPTETPAGYSYICDATGDIIENREGMRSWIT